MRGSGPVTPPYIFKFSRFLTIDARSTRVPKEVYRISCLVSIDYDIHDSNAISKPLFPKGERLARMAERSPIGPESTGTETISW